MAQHAPDDAHLPDMIHLVGGQEGIEIPHGAALDGRLEENWCRQLFRGKSADRPDEWICIGIPQIQQLL